MSARQLLAEAILLALGRVERLVTFAAFLILIAALFADVISRELTGAGLTWARDFGVLANLFVTMVGIGIASSDGAHLRPRFADRWLPSSWSPALEAAREALMAVFCVAFAAFAAVAVFETATLEERLPVLNWVAWPFQMVIPVVFTVAGVRHFILSVYPTLRPGDAAAVARQ